MWLNYLVFSQDDKENPVLRTLGISALIGVYLVGVLLIDFAVWSGHNLPVLYAIPVLLMSLRWQPRYVLAIASDNGSGDCQRCPRASIAAHLAVYSLGTAYGLFYICPGFFAETRGVGSNTARAGNDSGC